MCLVFVCESVCEYVCGRCVRAIECVCVFECVYRCECIYMCDVDCVRDVCVGVMCMGCASVWCIFVIVYVCKLCVHM